MFKFAVPAMLLISQLTFAENLAKQDLLETPRICRIERTNFSNLQAGNISYGGSQVSEEDRRLVKLSSYVELSYFTFTNAKGINVTHSLNVTRKSQTEESINRLKYVGVTANAKVIVTISVRDTEALVRLESQLMNKAGAVMSVHSFDAVCKVP